MMTMKTTLRDMTHQELEEFLQMTPGQIYEASSKFSPGVVQKIIILILVNVLLCCVTARPVIHQLTTAQSLDWWMWAELLYLVFSFGWIHYSFPSPYVARRLCEEQEELLAKRNRRRA